MKSMFKGALGALVVVLALSGLTAASALAAGAPIVETKPATSIRGTEATLNGTVNGNGATTKHYFEYGTTVSYGSKTPESESKTVSQTPNELAPHTTYHFRVVATNSYGTSYGVDEVFATPAEKPEVVLGEGQKITEMKIALSGKEDAEVEWDADKTIECRGGSEFTGYFVNSKQVEGKMRWSECSGEGAYDFCRNEIKEGHSGVQSEELIGTLGYINQAKKEVGLRLVGKSSEVWASKVNCLGEVASITGGLGGQLVLSVNTKIPAGQAFTIQYRQEKDKQITGELGGQLFWPVGGDPFGFGATLKGSANKAFEIQA